MNKKAFEQLKVDIEQAMDTVESLQKLYRGQTGQDFTRPLRLRKLDVPRGRVFIDPNRLAELLEAEAFLDKLSAAGVDNWEGYEIAQDMED